MNRKLVLALALTLLVGMLNLAFNVQRAKASGTTYIRADGSVEGTTHIRSTDNVTYYFNDNIYNNEISIQRSNIIVDGNGHTLHGSGPITWEAQSNGFNLTGVSNVTIKNTYVDSFTFGIYLGGFSYSNTIVGNNITNNWQGVGLKLSFGNSIYANNLGPNQASSVYMEDCSDNTIFRNNITSSGNGVFVGSQCSQNIIMANSITANDVALFFYGDNNTISGNNVINNSRGVYTVSSSNRFCNNNFINNTNNFDSSSQGSNVWDAGYAPGGNYWSDYVVSDTESGPFQNETGSDGIADRPYFMNGVNKDRYPLMGMFQSYDVTYFTLPLLAHSCNVTVISNSTVSNFVAPTWIEHPEVIMIEFNVTEEQGTTGFCRVSFPTAMMNGTYHVFVNGTEVPYTLLPCSNADYSHLYFTYTHSTEGVIIIPELPSFLVLPTFMIVTLLAVIAYRKKRISTR